MQRVYKMIEKVSQHQYPVLILGESGTGKELVARSIHFSGERKNRPFTPVDCSALVPTLIESELFGYVKGAFTGAFQTKQGLLEAAQGGTLFLDEIGDLPVDLQAKLLRVLQEREVKPVGSTERRRIDVRIIAATNRDLEAAYKKGEFRKDLYFRLNVVTLHLPSLRERRSDIHLLVHHFLDKIAPGRAIGISPAAMACMLQYDWPGNVRELENAVERAVTLGSQNTLELRDLPPTMLRSLEYPAESEPLLMPSKSALVSDTDLEEIEKVTIQRVFEQVRGDKMLAGKMLGISRATLYRKLKRYNIGMGRGA